MYDYYQTKLNIDYKMYLENHIKKYWTDYVFMEDIQEALKTAYSFANVTGDKAITEKTNKIIDTSSGTKLEIASEIEKMMIEEIKNKK